ncbi:hypothetical protein [Simplicispira psychrophila]|uniref:hypothetical protein n=1 Tax=Simplicispira psychrophila TaxID=80882 RepID=UPI000486178C|nr:hypothetical protein [Simplicispira psychrophila]
MNTLHAIETDFWPLKRSAVMDPASLANSVWQVLDGMLLVERSMPGARVSLRLALPSDWVGTEAMCDLSASTQVTAIIPSTVKAIAVRRLTVSAVMVRQHQQSCDHLLALRTGSVENRIDYFHALLQQASAGGQLMFPALRHIALLVDAAPETVCRVLAPLRPERTRVPLRLYRQAALT